MSGTALHFTNDKVPRSREYKDKKIIKEALATIKGTRYFKRVFFDGSVELVRFDYVTSKWVFLLFAEK